MMVEGVWKKNDMLWEKEYEWYVWFSWSCSCLLKFFKGVDYEYIRFFDRFGFSFFEVYVFVFYFGVGIVLIMEG